MTGQDGIALHDPGVPSERFWHRSDGITVGGNPQAAKSFFGSWVCPNFRAKGTFGTGDLRSCVVNGSAPS